MVEKQSHLRIDLLWATIVAGFLLLLVNLTLHQARIAPGAAEHAYCGQLICQGQVAYLSFISLSSPMVIYISVIPALIAKITGIHPAFSYSLFAWSLSLGSCLFSYKIQNKSKSRFVQTLLVVFTFWNCLSIYEFGQEEHLFVILVLPWLTVRYLRQEGVMIDRADAALSGILAAIGVGLSPILLLVLLMPEIFWSMCRSSKSWRSTSSKTSFALSPELIASASTIFLYAIVVFRFHCGQLQILELVAWNGILADSATHFITTSPDHREIFYALLLLSSISILLRHRVIEVDSCLAIAWGGFIFFVLAHSGLFVQALPMIFGIACALLFLATSKRFYFNINRNVGLALISSVLLIGIILQVCLARNQISLSKYGYIGSTNAEDLSAFTQDIEKNSKVGDKIIVLASGIRPTFPAVLQTNRVQATRFVDGQIFQIYDHMSDDPLDPDKPTNSADLANLLSELLLDIQVQHPSLLIIQSGELSDKLKNSGFDPFAPGSEFNGLTDRAWKDFASTGESRQHVIELTGRPYVFTVFENKNRQH